MTPVGMAAKLAEYITSPSTIRARVMDHFGRAPSVEHCANLRRAVEGRRQKHVSFADYKFRTECRTHDGPYEMGEDGIDRCKTCAEIKRKKDIERELNHIRQLQAERERKERERIKSANHQIADALGALSAITDAEFELVAEQVCKTLGLSVDEIKGPRRNQYIVDARAVVVRVLRTRNRARWSFPKLGRAMNRDHTTIVSLDKTFDYRAKRNPLLAQLVEMIG
jgi:hypothetical protein